MARQSPMARQSQMTGFELTLQLGAPLALGKLPYAPTLDSVLLGVLSGGDHLEGDAAKKLLAELCRVIRVEDGVPAASALWPRSEADEITWTHVRAKGWQDRRDPFQPSKADSYGRYKLQTSTRVGIYAAIWTWWGDGDIDGLRQLFSGLISSDEGFAIGAKRGSGFGAVVSARIREDNDSAWRTNGFDSVMLSRPVPVDRLDAWLEADGYSRDDLDPRRHVLVSLPIWPGPAWGPGPRVPTLAPVLHTAATRKAA